MKSRIGFWIFVPEWTRSGYTGSGQITIIGRIKNKKTIIGRIPS